MDMATVNSTDSGYRTSRRRFLQTAVASAAGMTLVAREGSAAPERAEPNAGRQPNIVLLYTDEYRHDHLGCAGHPTVRTPNLDRLASEGVRFVRTYCQGPLCQPSRASLITGRYVHQHGITSNGRTLDPSWPNMMKVLQRAGYRTAKVGKTHFYSGYSPSGSRDLRENVPFLKSYGLDFVLEEYDKYIHLFQGLITPHGEYLKEHGLYDAAVRDVRRANAFTPGMYEGFTSSISQAHDLTSFIADRSIEWLESYDADKPFFLWVSFVQPHLPYIDDPEWARVYERAEVPLGPSERPYIPDSIWGRYLRAMLKFSQTERLTPEFLTNTARHYCGMISLIDQRIGDIVKTVNDRGRGDNTWFIFTSDHGEMLGDHGLMNKHVFYKGSVLVPNIVRPPRGMKPRVVEEPVQTIDITSTVLDVAGTQPLRGAQGESLLPFMAGEGSPREAVFSELSGGDNPTYDEASGREALFAMVATERYRYTYERATKTACELFDLKEDPDELHNLVDDPAYKTVRDDLHKDYMLPFLQA